MSLVKLAAGLQRADVERGVDRAEKNGFLIELLRVEEQAIVAVGHFTHKIVENHVRRLIDGRGAGFPLADAIVALGGGDAFAGVAKFDVALEIKPAGGGIGVALDDHRP